MFRLWIDNCEIPLELAEFLYQAEGLPGKHLFEIRLAGKATDLDSMTKGHHENLSKEQTKQLFLELSFLRGRYLSKDGQTTEYYLNRLSEVVVESDEVVLRGICSRRKGAS